MVITPLFARVLLFATLLMPLSPLTAQAGGMTRELICNTSNGRQPQYIERNSSSQNSFTADQSSGTIFINPHAMTTRPQPVVNYEFAIACLQVSGSPDDMCSTVQFMRDRNLLFSSDLETLQNYFASRARATKNQSEADGFYQNIKQLYACF